MTNTDLENALRVMIGSQEAEAMYIGSSLLWSSTSPVPYDSRIEYLQSTNDRTLYIDTLFKQKDVEKFSIKYFSDNFDQPGYGNAMGCRQSSNNNEFQVTNYSSSISIGTRNTNMGNDAHQINEIIYTGGNTISVNGITKNIYNVTTLTLDDTIVLFGIRLAGIPTLLESIRIYYVTLEGNGKKLELIPVRKDGVGYMYDKVSGLLFGNSGTGDFVLGPDIVEIEYLESSGGLYINTDSPVISNEGLSGSIVMQRTGDATGELCYLGRTNTGGFSLLMDLSKGISIWVSGYPDKYLLTGNSYFDKNIHEIEFSVGNDLMSITVDNTLFTDSIDPKSASNGYMLLFAHNSNYKSLGRIYSCKLYYNNTLIYDFIPVRIGQVGYMYDRISNKLFGNNGSGDFILGPNKGGANFLDILYTDSNGNLSFTSEILPASEGKTPVALCVAKAGFFGTNEKARWISLKHMNSETPETGSLTTLNLYYGTYNNDISTISNISATHNGGSANGYLTDFGNTPNPVIPTLFTENNEWNISILGTVNEYAMTDIDGKNKTNKILATVTLQPNWLTDTTITNEGSNGYAPGACCCARYHTLGTQAGDWYLGACGEISMIVAKKSDINTKLSAINAVYSNDCINQLANAGYLSSTEYNDTLAYCVCIDDGYIKCYNKNWGRYIIAMLQY